MKQPKPTTADPKPPPPSMTSKEPAGSSTVPVWLFGVLGVCLLAVSWYLHEDAGQFSAHVYAPYRTEAEVRQANPKPAGDPVYSVGTAIYSKNCSPCHLNNGAGQLPMFPPLAGSEWVNDPSPDRLIRIALHGLHGPITVKGTVFNNIMVPWKDFLKDDEIAAVLTYVRRQSAWGNTAPAVTAEQVRIIRQTEARRDGPWTAAELQKLTAGSP